MNRDKRARRHNNKNNQQNKKDHRDKDYRDRSDPLPKHTQFRPHQAVSAQQIQEEDQAIADFKSSHQPECPKCGKAITDMSSAIQDKSGRPMHFECAMDTVSAGEQLENGDKIAYIGQGRFAVLNYPNIRDARHFSIKKIIEWEDRNERAAWRDEMADLYSQVR
ncbi:MAG: hypothetical protein J5857_07685 [Treponema sp.]|nr:hypothetical protein [Treponema sp.]